MEVRKLHELKLPDIMKFLFTHQHPGIFHLNSVLKLKPNDNFQQ